MYDSESEEWQTYKKGMDAYHDYGRALRDAERLQAKKKRAKRKAEEDIIKAADVYDSQDEVTQKPMKRGRRRRWLDMIEAREQKLEAAKEYVLDGNCCAP
jgi:ATPase subunit of ABC transporter with duplicated ATPase domains